ncbi:MAG: hypothetical protein ACLTAI_03085 [Thomasclavelia sp.]
MYKIAVEKEMNSGLLKEIDIAGLSIEHDINFVWRKNSVFIDYYQQLFKLFFEYLDNYVNMSFSIEKYLRVVIISG